MTMTPRKTYFAVVKVAKEFYPSGSVWRYCDRGLPTREIAESYRQDYLKGYMRGGGAFGTQPKDTDYKVVEEEIPEWDETAEEAQKRQEHEQDVALNYPEEGEA